VYKATFFEAVVIVQSHDFINIYS